MPRIYDVVWLRPLQFFHFYRPGAFAVVFFRYFIEFWRLKIINMIEYCRIISIIQCRSILLLLGKTFIRVDARVGDRKYLTWIRFLAYFTFIERNLLLLILVFDIVIKLYWSLIFVSAHGTIETSVYSWPSLIIDDATIIRDYFAYILTPINWYVFFTW